jgi:hypothetical protein
MSQAGRLEEMWRDNPDAKLEDADNQTGEEEMQPILLRYALRSSSLISGMRMPTNIRTSLVPSSKLRQIMISG